MNKGMLWLKRHWYLPVSLLLAAAGVLAEIPTGEDIVNLGWDTAFLFFLIYTAYAGLKKENAFSLIASFLSLLRHTYVLMTAIAVASFALGALITGCCAVLVMLPITLEILEKSERGQYSVRAASLVTVSSILGSMTLPSGSLHNLYLSSHMAGGEKLISTMLPLSAAGLAITFILPLFVLGRSVRDEIFLHSETDTTGSKPMRMLYACMMIIAVLTAAGTFMWLDIVILFAVVLLLFDRSIFRHLDWTIPASFILLSVFASSVHIQASGTLPAVALTEIIGGTLSSLLLLPSCSGSTELIRGINIGSLGLPTAMASLAALSVMKKDRKRFAISFILMSIPVAAVLLIVSALF